MDKDTLVAIGIIIEIASAIIFFIALIVVFVNKNYRKKALIIMIICVITCIIGFGICANNFTLNGMH